MKLLWLTFLKQGQKELPKLTSNLFFKFVTNFLYKCIFYACTARDFLVVVVVGAAAAEKLFGVLSQISSALFLTLNI